jgi:hypothetical protein
MLGQNLMGGIAALIMIVFVTPELTVCLLVHISPESCSSVGG